MGRNNMIIKRRTMWELGLALLFVAMAAIALMERPDRDVAAEDVRPVIERSPDLPAPADFEDSD